MKAKGVLFNTSGGMIGGAPIVFHTWISLVITHNNYDNSAHKNDVDIIYGCFIFLWDSEQYLYISSSL